MLRGRLFHVPPFLMFAEEPIHFTLLMPFKLNRSWDGGKRVLGAADLTVKMVNTNREVLLGRQFEYHWEDSGCIAPQGLAAMGKPLGGLHKVDAVIGPACSAACQVTSCLSSGQLIPQISWGCTSSSWSNKEEFGMVGLPSLPACAVQTHTCEHVPHECTPRGLAICRHITEQRHLM